MLANDTILLEQYKVYVELTDRVTERRLKTNRFYLSLISALLVGTFAFYDKAGAPKNSVLIFCGIFVILICLIWVMNINSYRKLNAGKFKVIFEMEKRLSYSPFEKEWAFLGEGKNSKNYQLLSALESIVPWLIITISVVLVSTLLALL